MDAAQKAIYQRVAQVKSQSPPISADQQEPQTATIDVTEQIKKLGELRDQGFLTEQEFDSKKQELLARM
jgi:predicted Zn-dependent peptidase